MKKYCKTRAETNRILLGCRSAGGVGRGVVGENGGEGKKIEGARPPSSWPVSEKPGLTGAHRVLLAEGPPGAVLPRLHLSTGHCS